MLLLTVAEITEVYRVLYCSQSSTVGSITQVLHGHHSMEDIYIYLFINYATNEKMFIFDKT